MAAVYLHIGLPKTGTTALQNFLTANGEALARHGICFPDVGLRYPHISWRRNAHFLITSYVDETGTRISSRPCAEYESTLDQIAGLAGQYDKILLSDEAIWQNHRKRADFWPALKEDFLRRGLPLKIIVYLRRQDALIESLYRQRVKASCLTDRFEDFIQNARFPLDYLAYADMLSGIFGRENLIIRIYDREQLQGEEHNIFSDFLDIFGLSVSDGFEVKQEVFNTSLDGPMLEFRRLVNRLPDMDKAGILNKSISLALSDSALTGAQEPSSLFSPEEHRAFLNSFAESNSRLAREYLGRADGFLFSEPSGLLPQYSADTDGLLRDAIYVYGMSVQFSDQKIQWLKKQLLELQKQNDRIQQQNKKLQEEVRELRESALWYRLKRKVRHLREN